MRIALTGGIGSGKSEVARLLASFGAVVIDSDLLSREVVEPGTSGLAQIVAAFGPQMLQPDGALNRQALGVRVFSDAASRAKLNRIVHPEIRELAGIREAAVRTSDPSAIVVHDIPLLYETGKYDQFDAVIAVQADEEVRSQRLAANRGMTPEQIRSRMAAQATDDQRASIATHVVVNEGTIAALHEQVRDVWRELTLGPAGRHQRT